MKFILRKKTGLLILAIIIITVILVLLPVFILQDQILTDKITSALQKTLAKNNLKINIQKIHWGGWNRLTFTEVKLFDAVDNTIPMEAGRLNLIFNPFALIFGGDHPETAVGEVKLTNLKIRLNRGKDGKWNFAHFFSNKSRKLQLKMIVTLEDGWLQYQDHQYGNYCLEKITGKIDIAQFPVINWNLKGQSDFCSTLRWKSSGAMDFYQLAGIGSVTANRFNLKTLSKKAAVFLPEPFPCGIDSGSGDFELNFAWNKKQFWLENGKAAVFNTGIFFPKITNRDAGLFQIKYLQTEFKPDEFKLTKAFITRGKTVLQVRGELNLKNSGINARIDAGSIDLNDLMKFAPEIKDISARGLANLKLNIGGTISAPVLDGEISINNTRVVYQEKDTVERISGRMTIKRNNIEINHLGGVWRDSLFQISGSVKNLFKPSFNLTVYGLDLNLDRIRIPELEDLGLQINGNTDLIGEITGDLFNPQLNCRAAFDGLVYKGVPVNNLQVRMAWDKPTGAFQIIELNGDIWKGHFTSKGEIEINATGASWNIKGNLSEIDMEETGLGIKGKVSADMVLKGAWKKGKPFDIGNILGTFNAKKLDFGMAFVDTTEGVFSFRDNFLTIDSLQAAVGEGKIFGNLLWNNNGLNANINAENIRFHDLFPDNEKYPFDGVFKGDFIFKGPLNNITGKISGVISDARWNSKQIGEIRGDLSYSDRIFNIEGLQVTSDIGGLAVKGQVEAINDPVLKLTVSSDQMDIKQVLERFAIIPPFKLNGLGRAKLDIYGPFSSPNFRGEINLKEPGFENINMEQGLVQLEGDLKEITLNKCQFSKGKSSINLLGKIDRDKLNIKISGHNFELENIHLQYGGKELRGVIDLEGNITGNLLAPIIQATVGGTNLNFGTFDFQRLSARIHWDQSGLEILDSSLNQNDSSLNINGKIIFSNPASLNLAVKARAFNIGELKKIVKFPENIQLGGKVSGMLTVSGNIKAPFVEATGEILDGSFDNAPMKGDFGFIYTPGRIVLQKLQLYYGSGSLLADGSWENDHSVKVQIQLTDFPLEITRIFLNPSLRLAGKATSNINLQWSDLGIFGDCGVYVSNFNLNKRDLGILHLKGKFSDLGLAVEESQLTGKSGVVNAEGYIPWPDQLVKKLNLPLNIGEASQKLSLNVALKNMAADLINNYFNDFSVLNGIIDGKLQIGGELMQPKISGDLNCNNVKVNIYSLPMPVEDFQAVISIDANKAYIEKGRGLYGKGKFNLTGNVGFDGFKEFLFDLDFSGSRLYYQNRYFDGFCDADVKLTANIDNTFAIKDSLLSGKATVYNCKTGILGVGQGGSGTKKWNPRFNLNVKAGSNVRCRIIGLADLDVNKGLLQVTGTYRDVVLDGEITSNNGVITFYGQHFRVNRGKAFFRNSKGFKPYLEIDSSQMKSQVEVFLNISGPFDNFSISLSSKPFLPLSELYSFLNWSELIGDQPLSPGKVLSGNLGLLTDTILGDFFYELRRTLDIDYFYLEPDFQGNAVNINVGKHITDQIFLSYIRSVASYPKETWALSFNLTPGLSFGWNYTQIDGSSWRLIYHGRF